MIRWLVALACLPLTLHADEVWRAAQPIPGKVIRVYSDHVIARFDSGKGRSIITAVSLRDGKTMMSATIDSYGAVWKDDTILHAGGLIDMARGTHAEIGPPKEQHDPRHQPHDPRRDPRHDPRHDPRRHHHHRHHDPRHGGPQQWFGPDGTITVEQGHIVWRKGEEQVGKWHADDRVMMVRPFEGGAYVLLEQELACVASDGTAKWTVELERSHRRTLLPLSGGAVVLDKQVRFASYKTGTLVKVDLGKGHKLEEKSPIHWLSDDRRWLLLNCPWSGKTRKGFSIRSGMKLIDGDTGKVGKSPTHGLIGVGKTGMVGSRMVDDKTSNVGWRNLYEVVSLEPKNRLATTRVRPAGVGDEHWMLLSDASQTFAIEVYRFPRKRIARIPIKDKAYARLIYKQIADIFRGKSIKGPDAFVNYGAWCQGVWWQTHDLIWAGQMIGKSRRKKMVRFRATSDQKIDWAIPTTHGLLVAKGKERGRPGPWILLK